ncbi:MAG TPA: hypothetical protein VJV77_07370, partial [Casimicrobiaceae bacterium]|nr:hypothetical protein [Casimicrobiaceae bacterium]
AAELAMGADEACNVQSLAVAWRAKLGSIALATLAALYPDALPFVRGAADNEVRRGNGGGLRSADDGASVVDRA